MLIVFPFFEGDRVSAKALAEHILGLGGAENHQCLLVTPQGTNTEGIEEPLRAAFGALETHTYQARLPKWPPGRFEHFKGWPQCPNEMFREVALLVAMDNRFGDFLWLEPDCVPASAKWLDTIESAYRGCGKAILGVVVDTVEMDSHHATGRQHVVGVAVYPKAFAALCPIVKSLESMSFECVRQGAMPWAFDAYFGPYTAKNCAPTRLIQHIWRSGEFREEGGEIIAGKVVTPGVENTVSAEAVLLHGCKDSSLMEIMRRRLGLSGSPIEVFEGGKSVGIRGASGGVGRTGPVSFSGGAGESAIPGEAVPAPNQPPKPNKRLKIPPPDVPVEQWILGDDGRPVPPFMKGQPEWERQQMLRIARVQPKGFAKLRKYAGVLKINTFAMGAEKLIEMVVLAERKKGKEEWTKGLEPVVVPKAQEPAPAPQPVAPPTPPVAAGPWSQEQPAGGDEITPTMRQKMMEMRRSRGLATA